MIQDPYLGRTVAARYRLVKRLGAGGMSSVYLAHHVMIERFSALKILRPDLARHPVHRERFLREARAVNRINHPNIVEISDVGESDGIAYLVMEYVDGPSLHEELAKGTFEWQRAVRIALQVAAALARAHQMGVIHRDLKPENLLLAKRVRDTTGFATYPFALHAEEDFVKLSDFGIAMMLGEPSLTIGAQLFGTPGYIAPETLEGVTADPRSDLYALGVILYEMTTSTLPFEGTGAALVSACLRESPIPPSRRVASYPPALEEIILRLLSRKAADRPPDAFAVYDSLVGLLAPEAAEDPGSVDSAPVVSSTPSGTRISFASQLGVREDAQTAFGASEPSEVVARLGTAELSATAEVASVRWHEALAELDTAIAAARRGLAPARGVELADELLRLTREKIQRLERVFRSILAQQARVDALETEGRTFRANVGRAIDQLVLDRSRERAHCDALAKKLAAVGASTEDRHSDASLWETAALTVESGTFEVTAEDLTFQIDALQRSLQERNVALEGDLLEATGALEGSLAAVRHLTYDLDRSLREARAAVGDESPRAPPTEARAVTASRIVRRH